MPLTSAMANPRQSSRDVYKRQVKVLRGVAQPEPLFLFGLGCVHLAAVVLLGLACVPARAWVALVQRTGKMCIRDRICSVPEARGGKGKGIMGGAAIVPRFRNISTKSDKFLRGYAFNVTSRTGGLEARNFAAFGAELQQKLDCLLYTSRCV